MTADPDDTLLVLRAQAGDIEAFDGLFRRYERLPPAHRAVLSLHYLEAMSLADPPTNPTSSSRCVRSRVSIRSRSALQFDQTRGVSAR